MSLDKYVKWSYNLCKISKKNLQTLIENIGKKPKDKKLLNLMRKWREKQKNKTQPHSLTRYAEEKL